jgi:hypothetical protein
VAGLAATPDRQAVADLACRTFLDRGQGIPLSLLFDVTDLEKARLRGGDAAVGFAQAHSVVRFLVARKGEPAFVRFLELGLKQGWQSAARTVYELGTLDQLQEAWIGWMKTAASRAGLPAAPAKLPSDWDDEVLPRIPPVKLSADAPKPAADDVSPIPTRTMKLPIDFAPDRRQSVKQISLAASRDEGKTWEVVEAIGPDQDAFTFKAREDGVYWLATVLAFKDGRVEPPELTRATPAQKLLVDTVPPTVRITAARRDGEHVRIEWEVDEKYPNEAATRVLVQVDGSPGTETVRDESGGRMRSARFKPDGPGAVTVRVVVEDTAGNRSVVRHVVPKAGG